MFCPGLIYTKLSVIFGCRRLTSPKMVGGVMTIDDPDVLIARTRNECWNFLNCFKIAYCKDDFIAFILTFYSFFRLAKENISLPISSANIIIVNKNNILRRRKWGTFTLIYKINIGSRIVGNNVSGIFIHLGSILSFTIQGLN